MDVIAGPPLPEEASAFAVSENPFSNELQLASTSYLISVFVAARTDIEQSGFIPGDDHDGQDDQDDIEPDQDGGQVETVPTS